MVGINISFLVSGWRLTYFTMNNTSPLKYITLFPYFISLPNIGAGTYTTSSLSTKSTTTSDPPNICKVKPQQLQTSSLPSASHFSQLSCMPSLIAQQQQSPQVYVSQSAAGKAFTLEYKELTKWRLFECFFSFKLHFKLKYLLSALQIYFWVLLTALSPW